MDAMDLQESDRLWRLYMLVLLPPSLILLLALGFVAGKVRGVDPTSPYMPALTSIRVLLQNAFTQYQEPIQLILRVLGLGTFNSGKRGAVVANELPLHRVPPNIIAELQALAVPSSFTIHVEESFPADLKASHLGEAQDNNAEDALQRHKRKRRRPRKKHTHVSSLHLSELSDGNDGHDHDATDDADQTSALPSPVEMHFQDISSPQLAAGSSHVIPLSRSPCSEIEPVCVAPPPAYTTTHIELVRKAPRFEPSSPFAFGLDLCVLLQARAVQH